MGVLSDKYSGPPLIRPALLHQKSGHIRGVAFLEGEKTIEMDNFCMKKVALLERWPLLRGALLEGDHCTTILIFQLI